MMVAIGTVAFTGSKQVVEESIYWFEVKSNGQMGDFIPGASEEPCSGTGPLCAAGLSESQVDLSEQEPTPLITDPNEATQHSYGSKTN